MVEFDKKKKLKRVKNISKKVYNRQGAPKVYDMNASIYIWKRKTLLTKEDLFYGNTSLYLMKNQLAFDIDTNFDYKILKKFIIYRDEKNNFNNRWFRINWKTLSKGYLKDKKVINLDIKNFKLNDKNYYYEKIDLNKLGTIKSKIDNIFKKYKNINSVINCSYPTGKSWGKCNFEKLNLNLLNKNLYSNLHSYIWSSCSGTSKHEKEKISGSLILFSSIYGMRGQDMSIYENTK